MGSVDGIIYAVGYVLKNRLDDLLLWKKMYWPSILTLAEVQEVINHLEKCGATAKIGASSKGKRKDGTSFHTSMGRWRAHLGTGAKLTKKHTNLD
eukprot:SAG31_NODE_305_length_18002_cov_7.242808_5_plen_95_part_00